MLLIVTTLLMGLTAGIFYCWSISVTKGLANLADMEYVLAFQSLNREIQNPLFFICFLGLVIMLPVTTWANYEKTFSARFLLLVLATLLYFIGVMGITIVGNIPMNIQLDKFETGAATAAELSTVRRAFEGRWNTLNNIRTVCCVMSFLLVILACIKVDSLYSNKLSLGQA